MPDSKLKQEPLRDLAPNERVVRTAGLRFILPCQYKPGDVLDEDTAALLNVAVHTAILNGFAETRRTLQDNPATTYQDLDAALQAFASEYKRTPRVLDTSDGSGAKTQEERDLIAFARPHFNKVFGGKNLARKDYEERLVAWVGENTEMLKELKAAESASMSKLKGYLSAMVSGD